MEQIKTTEELKEALLPEWMVSDLKKADRLALEARSSDQAGDQAGADQLRKEYDQLFAEIWKRLDGDQ